MSEEIADALINSPSRWPGLWLGLGSAGKRFILFFLGGGPHHSVCGILVP